MLGGHTLGGAPLGDKVGPTVSIFFGFGLTIDFQYRIFVATEEFITAGDDTPPLQPYSDVLQEPLDFSWSMANGSDFGGFITGRGKTRINNLDGRYDTLTQRYTTDGQPIEIRLGPIGRPQSEWPIVLKGLSSGEFIDDEAFEISVEDNAYKFDVPAQSVVFAGTGGLEGGEDLAGKPVPLCYGWVLNVEAPLVVPTEFLYRVHHGRVQAISAVYDQGVPLGFDQDYATVALLRAATIPSGEYATCLAEGYFRIRFDNQLGGITADVQGDVTDSVFAQTTVDIIRALIRRSTEVADPRDLYLPSLARLNAAQPAQVGIYIGHNEVPTVADVINALILPIGGYAGFRRDGKFHVGRIDRPAGPPTRRFDKSNFDPNPQKQRLPDGVWPPPWRWVVGYQKNYTVMTDPAGSVTDERRSFLAADYRYATAEAATIRADHPFGKEPDRVAGLFRNKSDAEAEAARRLALWRQSIGYYSFGVSDRDAALLNVGEQVLVTHGRGDLISGRYMMVVVIDFKAGSNSATIRAFG